MNIMKTAYFDCFAGISGDMCLGALVDAGADISEIAKYLKKIPLKNYVLESRKVLRNGISATKVDVIIKQSAISNQQSAAKKWADIKKIIDRSTLDKHIKEKGLKIFKKLFEAEAKVHGEPLDKVHLHEIGGVDCIVDIFGTLIGLDMLGVKKIYTSSINLGSGKVKTDHGILPVPAPATVELLRDFPVYSSGIPLELTTPTGAALITGLGAIFSALPEMRIEKIGYGAGTAKIAHMPNALRILIGRDIVREKHPVTNNTVMVMETNIDDMNPQLYEHVMEKLFTSGALDVFLQNIIMKKGRPAIKLTVIAEEEDTDKMADILFKETTTIGLRFYKARRKTLNREIVRIDTKYGMVRLKLSRLKDIIVNISPEYDDLKAIAKKTKLPLKKVLEDILFEVKINRPHTV